MLLLIADLLFALLVFSGFSPFLLLSEAPCSLLGLNLPPAPVSLVLRLS